jgi:hypothetical protein
MRQKIGLVQAFQPVGRTCRRRGDDPITIDDLMVTGF